MKEYKIFISKLEYKFLIILKTLNLVFIKIIISNFNLINKNKF